MRTIQTHPDGWIQTYTGRLFWPLDPQPVDVDIRDIAHALALNCRYSGHCDTFYSVAQHCVFVADLVEAHCIQKLGRMPTLDELRWALLHDAAEAYLADLPRPVKPEIRGFADVEKRIENAIADRFGLPREIPEVVHHADFLCYATEKPKLMFRGPDWPMVEGLPVYLMLDAMEWREAERAYLDRFYKLFPRERKVSEKNAELYPLELAA